MNKAKKNLEKQSGLEQQAAPVATAPSTGSNQKLQLTSKVFNPAF